MTTPLDAIRGLAATVSALRPTWDTVATSNQLLAHKDVPLHILAAAAIRCAQDPNNRTPAALKWMPLAVAGPGEREVLTGTSKRHGCVICGRTRDHCERARDVEQANGIDTHQFESQADAERNKASNQWSEADRIAVAESRSRRAQARAEYQARIASTPEDAA